MDSGSSPEFGILNKKTNKKTFLWNGQLEGLEMSQKAANVQEWKEKLPAWTTKKKLFLNHKRGVYHNVTYFDILLIVRISDWILCQLFSVQLCQMVHRCLHEGYDESDMYGASGNQTTGACPKAQQNVSAPQLSLATLILYLHPVW